jgi:hypothetical protein
MIDSLSSGHEPTKRDYRMNPVETLAGCDQIRVLSSQSYSSDNCKLSKTVYLGDLIVVHKKMTPKKQFGAPYLSAATVTRAAV